MIGDLPFAPNQTAESQDVILTSVANTSLVLRLPLYRGGDAKRLQGDSSWSGVWASDHGNQKGVMRTVQTFDRGAGYSRRPVYNDGGPEWSAWAESENVCGRFGYLVPSGEQTAVSVTTTWGVPVKILSFNNDLFFIFLNRIAYRSGGTGALTSLYSNSGDTFTDAEIWNGALRVALVCSHANPNQHFFVTLTPGGAPYTIINPTPASPAGTGATASTPQASLLQTVFWEYQGVADYRLACRSGDTTSRSFQYMIAASGDPYDPLNWGPSTTVGDSSFPIVQLVSSHDTIWSIKRDGVYAITDANAAAGGENITPYWRDQLDASTTPAVAYYWLDQLVVARPNEIEAINVNSWTVQDAPSPVGISHGRPNDTVHNGRYTALGSDTGWLLAAQVSIAGAAYVMYGIKRRRESPVAGITEYDWFPEIGPFADREITALCVHTPDSTLRPVLWIGLKDASQQPYLVQVDLFRGTSPLADTGHRYNTAASLTFTDEHWGSRRSNKSAVVGTLAVRNCGSGRKVDLFVQAGAGNTFPVSANGTVDTNVEAKHFNLYSAFARANVVRSKVVLTSTATVPVVVDEWSMVANLGFPLRRRGFWLVDISGAVSEGHGDLPNQTVDRTAAEVQLVSFCEGLETLTAIDPEGQTSIVVLDNELTWEYERNSAEGRRRRIYRVGYMQVS